MLTPLQAAAIAELQRQYPELREDYFSYLASVGWGETDAGPMVYEGPIEPNDIYGPRDELAGIVLLGDDFQGNCLGYNTESGCYGEVSDDGSWQSWTASEGFCRFVTPEAI